MPRMSIYLIKQRPSWPNETSSDGEMYLGDHALFEISHTFDGTSQQTFDKYMLTLS